MSIGLKFLIAALAASMAIASPTTYRLRLQGE